MRVFILSKKSYTVIILLVVFSFLFSSTAAIVKVSGGAKKVPIYSVKRSDTKIALTFNCAWGNDDISQILGTLEKYNVRASFFVVGTWAEKYPESVAEICNAGHEIGSHSYNHGHYLKMSRSEIADDIAKCDSIIGAIAEKAVPLVRGGYGEYNNDVLSVCESTEHTYIQWSLDSLDYKAKSADEILKRVVSKVQCGDIILMHTGTSHTAEVLDSLLFELCKNHDPVTVSELIYKDNFTIDPSGKQIPNQE